MHYLINEADQNNENDEENEMKDGEIILNLGDVPASMMCPYDPERIRYYFAEAALKEIGKRLSLLTKADNSLIDKKFLKKILKKELNRHLLNLNASQLKTFMENNRTFLERTEQMFKLCDK
jgi:hypothetical protein